MWRLHLGRSCCVLALLCTVAADTTPRLVIDTMTPYSSPDWDVDQWVALKSLRNIMGTMNGPREIYPVQDTQPVYNTTQYSASFADLDLYAVRFNDLNYAQGGYNSTSITQIFTAWPLTDAALAKLTSTEISALTNDDSNYVWTGLDYNVGAACSAGISLMDFRIGDTWHVANYLNTGEAVPISAGDDTLSFPAEWSFPTNVLTQNGIDLWAAVATQLAKRVQKLCTAQEKLVFDILTEIYVDTTGTGHFFPYNASVYASLFAATSKSIKAALAQQTTELDNQVVSFAGPNVIPTNSANEEFFTSFINACYKLGYSACPLDIATFHYFSSDSSRATTFAQWIRSKTYAQFHGTDFPVPRMAISAWGHASSGSYEYNGNVTGAAKTAMNLMTIQSTPVDFAIFYKFDGLNCDDVKYPCLVVGDSGKLKPSAQAFVLHSRLLQTATSRLDTDCYYCKGSFALSAVSNDTAKLGILLAGTGSDPEPPTHLFVKHWSSTCPKQTSTLTISSVTVGDDSVGAVSETKVSGTFSDTDNAFYVSSKSEPYSLPIQVDANNGNYAALLTVACSTDIIAYI